MVQSEDKFEVVITAAVFKGDNILLTRRALSKSRFPGQWTVPGGHLRISDYANEPKSSEYWYEVLEKALRREVREETGVEISNPRYVLNLANLHGKDAVIILLCTADYASGDVKLDHAEADGYAWVTESGLLNFRLIDGLPFELRAAFASKRQERRLQERPREAR